MINVIVLISYLVLHVYRKYLGFTLIRQDNLEVFITTQVDEGVVVNKNIYKI